MAASLRPSPLKRIDAIRDHVDEADFLIYNMIAEAKKGKGVEMTTGAARKLQSARNDLYNAEKKLKKARMGVF
jgi:hypothetical protein